MTPAHANDERTVNGKNKATISTFWLKPKSVGYHGKSVGYRETVYTVGYRGKSAGYRGIPWEAHEVPWKPYRPWDIAAASPPHGNDNASTATVAAAVRRFFGFYRNWTRGPLDKSSVCLVARVVEYTYELILCNGNSFVCIVYILQKAIK